MADRIWARTTGDGAIDAFVVVDESLSPGEGFPAEFSHDITSVPGAQPGWVAAAGSFVAPPLPLVSLTDQRSDKAKALSASCAAAITGGFTSSALGAAHAYPSSMTDQQNLTASVTASLLPGLPSTWTTPFWCADAADVWARRAHTNLQIQQVGLDGMAMVLAAQNKLATLMAEVAAAATREALDAITWG